MGKPLVDAALGRTPSRQPIWFLRQAGRYLPEYMEVRNRMGFVELCRSPKWAAEVTLQPMRRFDLDASIIFSDILIPCTAMGQELTFGKGHGPKLSRAVRSAADLKALKKPDAARELGYVGEAIAEVKKNLSADKTMIGFAGAPFTVATYMVEGEGSKEFLEIKKLLFTQPTVLAGLLDLLVEVTSDYLAMQVKAGADCLMLFDTWAGQIAAADYREIVAPRMKRLFETLKSHNVPLIYFPGQGSELYPELNGLAMDVIAVDWRCRLERSIRQLKEAGLNVSVQGNLDPLTLVAPEDVVRRRTRDVMAQAKGARGHIFNVGHGVTPHTNPDAITWVIDEIRKGT